MSGLAADRHVPVMRERIVELLAPALSKPGAVVLDATLGMGGHTEALLQACPTARVIGIDRDPEALELAGGRLAQFGDRFIAVQAVYDEIPEVMQEQSIRSFDAILFDLGVSSLQLDEAERGFAYSKDAPLDMRMDPTRGITAAEVLNTYEPAELIRILRDYGEERFAKKVTGAIVRAREVEKFTTSAPLVELLRAAIPMNSQRSGGHPAKRTFQALRIEVNEELSALERALPQAIDACGLGGRVAVLSYHSLEDRMVKRVLSAGSHSSAPHGLPVELPEHQAYLRLLCRGAEEPSPQEIADNPRAASAKLRAAERIRPKGRTR
ncbi:16S rRNA (cytosine(1402)-N(4))-methyltransferase RsmH [Gephyromycinifex aptenodytis]|uniref:16S rRNA (cytosine(1402)-N(4))-methyltransferase RsmH n=1 Tax=Gephyromycinifex aptenodytis TaxID=2716227 RepID=UPI001444CA43|nr:16S rRNA (cytosine(1402)-N(4))-methyltransferase RsmH [Gephyromycinifex aptenodytis]